MSSSVNRVILLGNIGKDPEIKTINTGVKVATFPLATTEAYRDKDGNWQEQTDWHNIVMWRVLAERAEKLKKGMQIYIEGKIKTRSYEDKDGNKKYLTEIVADTFKIVNSRNTNVEAISTVNENMQSLPTSNNNGEFQTEDIIEDIINDNNEDDMLREPTNDLPF